MSQLTSRGVDAARVRVLRVRGEYGVFSLGTVPPGGHVFDIDGELTDRPTRYSVQVGRAAHIGLPEEHTLEETLDRFFWRFMNHSCDPNAVIRGRAVFARRSIDPWEEITFHYNTTEYEMAEPFDCRCRSRGCHGRIRGLRFLTRSDRERLRPWLGAHLLGLLDEPAAGAAPAARDGEGGTVH